MANAIIGIDLGSHYMKAVELVAGREGTVLTRAAVKETPPGTIANGVVIDPDAVSAALTDMLRSNGFSAKKAVISVGGQADMVIRVTEVPRMTLNELRNAMKWDLERHLPFPREQAKESISYSIYQGPDADPTSPNMEVTITVLKDENCEKYLRILNAAKLEPAAIDAQPFAAGRALVSAPAHVAKERCTAIVNIGAELTDISIIQNDWLRFNRGLPLAGDTLTSALGQAFIVESDEAQQLKHDWAIVTLDSGGARPQPEDWGDVRDMAIRSLDTEPEVGGRQPIRPTGSTMIDTAEGPVFGPDAAAPAFVDTVDGPIFGEPDMADEPTLTGVDQIEMGDLGAEAAAVDGQDPDVTRQQVSDAIKPVVAELAAEIRRSVEYYRSRHDDIDVERVILIGGSARVKNIATFVEMELGIPTEIGDPFASVAIDPGAGYDEEYLADIAPIMAVAVGAGLHPWY
ncbi:MAG TPA: type IV pilus assembly protein PilM [Armatimonadota bacterium]|nr:type IV pilus assembly protein PilM [Armatimonadota bacterium]